MNVMIDPAPGLCAEGSWGAPVGRQGGPCSLNTPDSDGGCWAAARDPSRPPATAQTMPPLLQCLS